MKSNKIVLIFIYLVHFSISFSQNTDEERELVKIIESQKPIPKQLFIDPSILHPMVQVSNVNWRQVWNDKDDSLKLISQFYDVRFKFESNQEAIQFHKKYLILNSEKGIRIKRHGLIFEGANQFYAFDASEEINKMMNMVGMRAYCLVYVVDNFVVKEYLTCTIDTKINKFQPFVSESINKIKNYNLNGK